MNQSKMISLVESILNTVVGFGITLAMSPVVYPLFGVTFTATQNLGIALIFTVTSIIRSYVIRRWFNGGYQRFATKVVNMFSKKVEN